MTECPYLEITVDGFLVLLKACFISPLYFKITHFIRVAPSNTGENFLQYTLI